MTGLVLQTQADAPAGLLDGLGAQARLRAADVPRRRRGGLARSARRSRSSSRSARAPAPPAAGRSGCEREIEWLRDADAAGVPILGICFGAQALATALGGCVHKLSTPEVGWVTVASNDDDRIPAGPWMAWHEDGFTLPPLAYELASNAFGVQAFCHCRHLAVQFHPEVTPEIVEGWARSDHEDLQRAGVTRDDLDPAPLRGAAPRRPPTSCSTASPPGPGSWR